MIWAAFFSMEPGYYETWDLTHRRMFCPPEYSRERESWWDKIEPAFFNRNAGWMCQATSLMLCERLQLHSVHSTQKYAALSPSNGELTSRIENVRNEWRSSHLSNSPASFLFSPCHTSPLQSWEDECFCASMLFFKIMRWRGEAHKQKD